MANQLLKQLGLAVSAMSLIACTQTDTKPMEDRISRIEMEVEQADELDADEYAPVALREARLNLDAAKQKIAAKKYGEARHSIDKAALEIEYAMMKTRSEKAQAAAEQLRLDMDTLRKEVNPS